MMPVTDSIFSNFTRTDFDEFLDSLGLQGASPQVRSEMAVHVREIVLNMVFDMMADRLSPEKFKELAALMEEAPKTDNAVEVNEFLTREIPGIDVMIDEAVANVKDSIRRAMANPTDTIRKFIETHGTPEELAQWDAGKATPTTESASQAEPAAPTPPQEDGSLDRIRALLQEMKSDSGQSGQDAIKQAMLDETPADQPPSNNSAIDDELNTLNT